MWLKTRAFVLIVSGLCSFSFGGRWLPAVGPLALPAVGFCCRCCACPLSRACCLSSCSLCGGICLLGLWLRPSAALRAACPFRPRCCLAARLLVLFPLLPRCCPAALRPVRSLPSRSAPLSVLRVVSRCCARLFARLFAVPRCGALALPSVLAFSVSRLGFGVWGVWVRSRFGRVCSVCSCLRSGRLPSLGAAVRRCPFALLRSAPFCLRRPSSCRVEAVLRELTK